jgi:hypothetical protein
LAALLKGLADSYWQHLCVLANICGLCCICSLKCLYFLYFGFVLRLRTDEPCVQSMNVPTPPSVSVRISTIVQTAARRPVAVGLYPRECVRLRAQIKPTVCNVSHDLGNSTVGGACACVSTSRASPLAVAMSCTLTCNPTFECVCVYVCARAHIVILFCVLVIVT